MKSKSEIAEIETMRSRLGELSDDETALLDRPAAASDIVAKFSREVGQIAGHGKMLLERAAGSDSVLFELVASTVQERVKQLSDNFAKIVYLNAATLQTALPKVFENLPTGIKSAEREQQLTAIKKERRALEQREQEIIASAAARGIIIPQRPDADPAIVLNIKRTNGRVTYDQVKLQRLRSEFESACAASASKNRDVFALRKKLENLRPRVEKLQDGNVEKKMLNDEIHETARSLSDLESAMADIEQRRGVLDRLVSNCDHVLADELSR